MMEVTSEQYRKPQIHLSFARKPGILDSRRTAHKFSNSNLVESLPVEQSPQSSPWIAVKEALQFLLSSVQQVKASVWMAGRSLSPESMGKEGKHTGLCEFLHEDGPFCNVFPRMRPPSEATGLAILC